MCRFNTLLMCSLVVALQWMGADALASENGLSSYPIGVNTVLNGVLPAPGQTYYYDYAEFYRADAYNDDHGKSAVPSFKARISVNASRVLHTWNATWGPFSLTSGIVVPLVRIDNAQAGTKEQNNGLGDVITHPVLIGYSNPSKTFFTFIAPFDMLLPTGEYKRTSIANTGLNHYTYMPSWQTTWFPTSNIEVSTGLTAEFNFKNHATDYTSGTSATFDGLIGYSFNEKWQLGLQGFHSQQLSDDRVNGDVFLDGNRGRSSALGPQVRYMVSPGVAVVLKMQHEFDVRNRTEGDRYWLQFAFPL